MKLEIDIKKLNQKSENRILTNRLNKSEDRLT